MCLCVFVFVDSLFFGEDVYFEVFRDFRILCFYLFDIDFIGRDIVLGKVGVFVKRSFFFR